MTAKDQRRARRVNQLIGVGEKRSRLNVVEVSRGG